MALQTHEFCPLPKSCAVVSVVQTAGSGAAAGSGSVAGAGARGGVGAEAGTAGTLLLFHTLKTVGGLEAPPVSLGSQSP